MCHDSVDPVSGGSAHRDPGPVTTASTVLNSDLDLELRLATLTERGVHGRTRWRRNGLGL